MLSGFFFKTYEPGIFFIKKVNNIIVPFIFWFIVSDIWNICYHRFMVESAIAPFIDDYLYRRINCNIALWFLLCLFTTNVIFYFTHFICKENKMICIVIFIFALMGCLLFKNGIQLPLWIDSSISALPFFFFGYYCKNSPYLSPKYSMKKSLLLGIGLILVSYLIYYTFDYAQIKDIRLNSFQGSPIMAYLNSIAIIMGVLLLCKAVKWLPIVSYFGRYSIIVLCIHYPLFVYVPRFIEKISEYEITTIWERTAIIMIICWLAIPICKKWLPYFVAQKPLFKVDTINSK